MKKFTPPSFSFFFFFNDPATTEIYTLPLHDALPIYLANNLVRAGMRVVQSIGVPAGPVDEGVDAVVVALKSRTIAPADAIAQSLQALQWLQAQGANGRAPQIYFKYCSKIGRAHV